MKKVLLISIAFAALLVLALGGWAVGLLREIRSGHAHRLRAAAELGR
jgi:hypothetical protein